MLLLNISKKKTSVSFVFAPNEQPNSKLNLKLEIVVKISAIVIPLLIFLPNYKQQIKPTITGKYKIVSITNTNNYHFIDSIAAQFDLVYFDLGEFFAFTSSDFKKRQVGILSIDEKTREFYVDWVYPDNISSNLKGKINPINSENNTTIIGQIDGNHFEIELHKENIKSIWNTY